MHLRDPDRRGLALEALRNLVQGTNILCLQELHGFEHKVLAEFNTLLPDSNLYWIDKCGHAPMMEHPEEFNTTLQQWLETRKF